VWTVLLITVAALNVGAFAAFGIDKARARNGGRRIPEARLLALAFLAGFPGAWAGVELFRHKTRKASFQAKLILVTVLNPAWVLLYLAATGGFTT
jgi:uncharacterized membrane protein YsdA (DUF1294 family)